MLLFTNKGELLGDSNFGCDLQRLLFETRIAKSGVRTIIIDQINEYIPEIQNVNYIIDVEFSTDPENFQEVMEINFTIADYEVYSFIR
jgi:phage baseplate assembly protein W